MYRYLFRFLVVVSMGFGQQSQAQPCEAQKLVASDGGEGDQFGFAIDVDGAIAVLGAIADFVPGIHSGSAYVFKRVGPTWIEVQKLTASDGEIAGEFGHSIAMQGEWLAVGATAAEIDGQWSAGAVYIFHLENDQWVETQRLESPTPFLGAQFGFSIDIDSENMIIGEPAEAGGAPGYGAAFVFEYSSVLAEWRFKQRLQAPDPVQFDSFGLDVAIDGERIAVTSRRLRDIKEFSFDGLLYFYERDANIGHWKMVQRFHVEEGDDLVRSRSLDLEGDLAAAGFTEARSDDNIMTGATILVEFNQASKEWIIVDRVTPPDGQHGDRFGAAVTLSDGSLLVGAPQSDLFASEGGAVYLYTLHDGQLSFASTFIRGDVDVIDQFGRAIAGQGPEVLVSSLDDDLANNAGAVHVFSLNGECGEAATLTNITTVFGEHLSGDLSSVLLSDDTHYRVRSQPGFAANEPNLVEVRLRAQTDIIANPETLFLTVEGRLNNPGGTGRLRLRNWTTNTFQTVHNYNLGTSDATTAKQVSDPAPYIRASDGRIDLSIRQSMIATFSITGFRSLTDYVRIGVE